MIHRAASFPRNSTNDRSFEPPPAAIRALGYLSSAAPSLASEEASRLFLVPPRVPAARGEAAAFLATGERLRIPGKSGPIAAWSWGSGPTILLAHGWGGRATQWRAFVPALVSSGFRAVAFDLPAHGASSGFTTSVPGVADAILAVSQAVGGARGVVAHSMGGASAVLALTRGLGASGAVVIGAPSDALAVWNGYARAIGLAAPVSDEARARVERRVGIRLDQVNARLLGPRVSAPLLVVHDRDDAEVPFRCGRETAASVSGSSLIETQGLGHRKILRDEAVISQSIRFLARSVQPAICGSCGLPAGRDGARDLCASCLVERDLFDREGRLAA